MKKFVIALMFLSTVHGFTYFAKSYGKSGETESLKAVFLDDGGYLMVGTSNNNGTLIMKVDSAGTPIWYTLDTRFYCNDVVKLGDAGVAGVAQLSYDTLVFFKFNNSGNIYGSLKYFEPSGTQIAYTPRIIKTSPNTLYIASVMHSNTNQRFEVLLIKIDTTGSIVWSKIIDTTHDISHYELAIGNRGDSVLISPTEYTGQAILIYIDPNGSPIWSRLYWNLPAFYHGNSICNTGDGFNLGGWIEYSSSFASLFKVDYQGTFLWHHTYHNPNQDVTKITHLVKASNGDILFTGWFATNGRVNPNGELLWSKKFNQGSGYCIRECEDGQIVTGGNYSSDYLLYTLTSDGEFPNGCTWVSDYPLSDISRSMQERDTTVEVTDINLSVTNFSEPAFPYDVNVLCSAATGVNEDCGCEPLKFAKVVRGPLIISGKEVKKVYSEDGRLVFEGNKARLNLPAGFYFIKERGKRHAILIVK